MNEANALPDRVRDFEVRDSMIRRELAHLEAERSVESVAQRNDVTAGNGSSPCSFRSASDIFVSYPVTRSSRTRFALNSVVGSVFGGTTVTDGRSSRSLRNASATSIATSL